MNRACTPNEIFVIWLILLAIRGFNLDKRCDEIDAEYATFPVSRRYQGGMTTIMVLCPEA